METQPSLGKTMGTATAPFAKRFFSWEQIHETVMQSVDVLQDYFAPTILVGISGGGLVPSRMLRSGFKVKTGKTLPIQVIGYVHYDDDKGRVHENVIRTQWLNPNLDLSGARLLLVDEVDDSRKTLAIAVSEMYKYIGEMAAQRAGDPTWVEPKLAVYVIHNKYRPKEAEIDPRVMDGAYFCGEEMPNMWHVYPWDAMDIISHTAVAHAQEHYFREKPGEVERMKMLAMAQDPTAAVSAHVHYATGASTNPSQAGLLRQPSSGINASAASRTSSGGSAPPAVNKGPSPGGASALTAALAGAPQGQPQPTPSALPLPRIGSGCWEDDPTGMYSNMGPIPKGLEPRFGSLTLVDTGAGFMSAALGREEEEMAAAPGGNTAALLSQRP